MELLTKFGVDLRLLIAQAVNFLLLLGILTWAVYRPLLRVMAERTRKIQAALDDAKAIAAERAALATHRQSEHAKVKAEVAGLLAEADRSAQAARAEALAQAKAAAEQLVEKARGLIAQEKARLLTEVQREVARLVADAAEVVLQQKLEGSADVALVERAVAAVSGKRHGSVV